MTLHQNIKRQVWLINSTTTLNLKGACLHSSLWLDRRLGRHRCIWTGQPLSSAQNMLWSCHNKILCNYSKNGSYTRCHVLGKKQQAIQTTEGLSYSESVLSCLSLTWIFLRFCNGLSWQRKDKNLPGFIKTLENKDGKHVSSSIVQTTLQ